MMSNEMKPGEGVREKKRREMRRRITEAGLKLFAENGYTNTTLDAIAEAAGIARRTFFHYFRAKEDIILAWQQAQPDDLYAEILRQDEKLAPIAVIQVALMTLAVNLRPDIAGLISGIVQTNERLQAGNQAKFVEMELAAYKALRERWPAEERQTGLRLAAIVAVGTMRLAIDQWIAEGYNRALAEHLNENFHLLRSELQNM
ncbi:TetR/AcrR family transcriptional regulator [Atlantibacter hermannii]|uniref:TetR/AcrR family transcriptional regulator n=1 Tax=Atlantibacter hermannii TaxID=565 RepID=UPI0028B0220A|nr:helix-turn-helix domain-containing protein [Atlantibacter hermannii]